MIDNCLDQYACFATTCTRKFSTPGKRRRHLIDGHKYPAEVNSRSSYTIIIGLMHSPSSSSLCPCTAWGSFTLVSVTPPAWSDPRARGRRVQRDRAKLPVENHRLCLTAAQTRQTSGQKVAQACPPTPRRQPMAPQHFSKRPIILLHLKEKPNNY